MNASTARLSLKKTKRMITHGVLSFPIWMIGECRPPSPYYVKKRILLTNAINDAPWIETGTYLGETTRFLARHFPSVLTLEPSLQHFNYNARKFHRNKRVTVVNKSSEEYFELALQQFDGNLNIYLDGHASGDGTFCGTTRTPIREELKVIEQNLHRFRKIFVAIDDFRVFGDSDGVYPSNFSLVEFCSKNNLTWSVQHDIFMLHSKILS